ncbi:MAG: flagellar export chaperone FliS [Gallionellaceae bacterium]|jgi:flagellar protein FliS
MNPNMALNTYKNVGLESGVAAADPHKLILMLYQGAILAISSAKNQMLRKQISAKGASISKAIKIIDEGLKACLNVEAGGEIGKNLYDLYDYMNQRLLIANLKNDPAILDEISSLLNELKGAWESIRPGAQSTVTENLLAITQPAPVAARKEMTPKSAVGKQAALMYGRM